MRITEKNYCGYDIKDRKSNTDYTCEEIFNVIQKLGKLEDIFDDIENEIPIRVIEKMVLSLIQNKSCDVWVLKSRKDKRIVKCDFIGIRFDKIMCLPYNDDFYFPYQKNLKDYKKTWWLKEDKSE